MVKSCRGPGAQVSAKLPPYSSARSGSCPALVSSTRLCGPSHAGPDSWSDTLQSVILGEKLRFKKDGPTSLLYFGDSQEQTDNLC